MHPKTKLTIEVTDTQYRQLLILVQLAKRAEYADKAQGKPPGAIIGSKYATLLEPLVKQYEKQGGSLQSLVPLPQFPPGWKPWD